MPRSTVRYISAGDIEKYSYCPLSWWLSREEEVDSEELARGVKEHQELGKTLWKIDSGEKTAREYETLVFWWATVATIIATFGLALLPYEQSFTISEILGVVALIWILVATFFLYKATRAKIHSAVVNYEKTILIMAIVAALAASYSVIFLYTDVNLAIALEIAAIMWLVGASFFLYRTLRSTEIVDSLRKEFRVKGKVEYIDMEKAKALRSETHGLLGRPDYIIKLGDQLIPVEEKKGRTPRGPLFSHILQVAAYCLLIEDSTGKAPHYGILKYPEHEHEIEYDADLKNLLLTKLEEMRNIMDIGEAHRNHNRPGKCKNCSRRDGCPEKLA
ncbi:MAG TPA: CRISPR-associated protein Cas4 [Thermoplasmata archaeon]